MSFLVALCRRKILARSTNRSEWRKIFFNRNTRILHNVTVPMLSGVLVLINFLLNAKCLRKFKYQFRLCVPLGQTAVRFFFRDILSPKILLADRSSLGWARLCKQLDKSRWSSIAHKEILPFFLDLYSSPFRFSPLRDEGDDLFMFFTRTELLQWNFHAAITDFDHATNLDSPSNVSSGCWVGRRRDSVDYENLIVAVGGAHYLFVLLTAKIWLNWLAKSENWARSKVE